MQLLRTYERLNPLLLYSEVDDLVKRYGGMIIVEKTYKEVPPGGGGLKGSIIASFPAEVTKPRRIFGSTKKVVQKEAFNARLFGLTKGETKLMIYIDEEIIPSEKAEAMAADLDFFTKSYEEKD